MYSYFEKTFIENFYKTSIKINILSTYFRSTNISNVYDITLKHFTNISINTISIYVNVSIIYSNNHE